MNFIDKKLDFSKHIINGLTSELKGYYLYKKYAEDKNSVLFVTSNLYEANIIYQTILNYTSDVQFFPMDDFLTSEALAISPEFLSYRLDTLNKIIEKNCIVITNLMGYLRFLPNRNDYKKSIIHIKVGDCFDIKKLENKLYEIGYERETVVSQSGQIAVRGFILDVFPFESNNPVRIEFFDDEIEKISEFNVNSQLRYNYLNEINIYPTTEFIVNDIDNMKHYMLSKYIKCESISKFMNNPIIFFNNYNQIFNSYKMLVDEINNYKIENNIDKNIKYMYDFDEIKNDNIYYFDKYDVKAIDYRSKTIENLNFNKDSLEEYLKLMLKKDYTIVISLNNKITARKVVDKLEKLDVIETSINSIIDNYINIVVHKMNNGFMFGKYIVISEKELFNKKDTNYIYKAKFRMGNKIRDINKLEKGDYIVHYIHGIGIYQGIKTLNKNGLERDYIMLEYKDHDKLYVPVEKIDMISKYSSKDDYTPVINKLGSSEWAKTKLKTKKRVEKIAIDLLKLYSERQAAKGFAFFKDSEEQIMFEEDFPYKETDDQLKATLEIKKDMESDKPMDRLLCGDVGYGKTEVAFRAVFKAIMSHKQVVILCPTTILSNQHYQNAKDRFSSFDVEIELLNRFVPMKKQKEIIDRLKEGKIDLLIGTHRVLGNDIEFKNLGLLIIDEEQRFGVKHKEKIKEYKNNIDVLTLSATPIPRTLQMAVSGIRGLSLIETPPVDRFPVQTYVLEENNSIIKDAIYKEMSRDGQVFVLYNSIENMEDKKSEINKIVPNARITYIHGRMDKTQIENVMYKFQNKEYDVLLCTTIIETGIDIPSVNTLIVVDADRFGLSQLYQIRGRVGRSNKIAYCYLMYHKGKVLSDIAKKRLSVIKDFTELGSGFAIAMRDLSIRGAGDLLGGEQSGFVDSVGVDMFLNMLSDEVDLLKGKKVEHDTKEQPLIEVSNNISDDYVKEEDLKIEIHKKISEIDSLEKLNSLKNELEDRFGTLNERIVIYMYEQLFEKKAKDLNITNIKQNKNSVTITLPKEYNEILDGDKLFVDVISLNRNFRFSMRLGMINIELSINKLDKHYIYYLNDLLDIIRRDKKTNI